MPQDRYHSSSDIYCMLSQCRAEDMHKEALRRRLLSMAKPRRRLRLRHWFGDRH